MTEKATELRLERLENDCAGMKKTLYGSDGKMGLRTKFALMFWGHWPLGVSLGAILKSWIEKIIG